MLQKCATTCDIDASQIAANGIGVISIGGTARVERSSSRKKGAA